MNYRFPTVLCIFAFSLAACTSPAEPHHDTSKTTAVDTTGSADNDFDTGEHGDRSDTGLTHNQGIDAFIDAILRR